MSRNGGSNKMTTKIICKKCKEEIIIEINEYSSATSIKKEIEKRHKCKTPDEKSS